MPWTTRVSSSRSSGARSYSQTCSVSRYRSPHAPPQLTESVFPAAAPRPPCPWRYPGTWTLGTPLRQGMKLVITGDARTTRDVLIRTATNAGFDVMNSGSSRTSVVICNHPALDTRKAELARQHRTPIITEDDFLRLLPGTSAGEPKETSTGNRAVTPRGPPAPARTMPTGPLTSSPAGYGWPSSLGIATGSAISRP